MTVTLALAVYAGAWAAGTVWRIRRRPSWLALTGTCLLVVLALAAWGTILTLDGRDSDLHPFVVITREHVLHRGNGTSYPPHEKIPVARPGMEARFLFERGGWLQIEFAGGYVGWVPASVALVGPGER
jgi:hypothetical protein